MPTLFVTCKSCGSEFPTPIGEREVGKSGVIVTDLPLNCPKCSRGNLYSTGDFHIPPGVPNATKGGTAVEDLTAEHAAKQKGRQERLAGTGVVSPDSTNPHVE
jgi:hypothetical protein